MRDRPFRSDFIANDVSIRKSKRGILLCKCYSSMVANYEAKVDVRVVVRLPSVAMQIGYETNVRARPIFQVRFCCKRCQYP